MYHWAASVLQRLNQCGLLLITGGHDPSGNHDEQLNSDRNQNTVLRRKQVRKLASLSNLTNGDLLEQTVKT